MVEVLTDCPSCHALVSEPDARFCPLCGSALPVPLQPLGEGSRVTLDWGEVTLGDIVGEGGMGLVRRGWLHYDPDGPRGGTSDHPVAIKLLNPLLRGRARARRLFVGEAEALERLSHPNVVHFFALVEIEGQLALIMELVHGNPVSRVIAEHTAAAQPGGLPCMPMVPAWRIFSQLLGALAATHALGIVHRDVKPSNILLRHDGLVKLTDYGIARLPSSDARVSGAVAPGTGAYMSPEQVTGGALDARSDLYSAAIVLFEMLSGTTPFERGGRDEMAVRASQLQEPSPSLSSLVPQAPPILDVIMARALAKDPIHRFGSAIELGENLRSALGLSDTPGWQAQRRLAENAVRLSQLTRAPVEPTVPDAEAQILRTDVMNAYHK
jgi:serine/threonine protein kinase